MSRYGRSFRKRGIMKILVLGAGQMGKAVQSVATDRGHTVLGPLGRADADDAGQWDLADVAVDFSVPTAVAEHVELALRHRTPLVVGTTGFEAQREEIARRVVEEGGTLIWGANFSIGFHMLAALTRVTAHLARTFPEFDAGVFEHHHRLKRDAPSGSALELARTLVDDLPAKTRLETGALQEAIDAEALHVTSLRAGTEPGLHRVYFDGPFETLTLEHRVRDRSVFAAGGVYAAEQTAGRKGMIHFRELVEELMSEGGAS